MTILASLVLTVVLAAEPTHLCTIERVIDGDTVVCEEGGIRVRLLTIDAPERTQEPYGRAATEYLSALAPPGTVVRMEYDVRPLDRYGRALAYLWLFDGRMLNELMVRAGYAVVAVYPPDVRHVDRLRDAEVLARAERRGLWATDAFSCEPVDHRAGRC